jgi:hypothetical protein
MLLHRELSMTDLFETFNLPTLKASHNAISSPALASGHTRCAKLVGPTPDLFGQEAAPANHSAGMAQSAGLTMNGIFGPIGSASSASVSLTQSLVSKLIASMEGHGSTLYALTWKEVLTPSRRPLYALRASALPTSDRGCIGWPTPRAEDAESTGFSAKRLAAGKRPDNLHSVTRLLVPGKMLNGLNVSTENGCRLNPAHTRWLQGIPAQWASCAPTGTRLTPC